MAYGGVTLGDGDCGRCPGEESYGVDSGAVECVCEWYVGGRWVKGLGEEFCVPVGTERTWV